MKLPSRKELENLQAWIRADVNYDPDGYFVLCGWRRPDGSLYRINIEIPWKLFGNDHLALDRVRQILEVSMENGRTKELVFQELDFFYHRKSLDPRNFLILIHKDEEFKRQEREYEENH